MLSRRSLIKRASTVAVASAFPAISEIAHAAPKANPTGEDPLLWVDPRIGTGGHGHCFPGASLPFGAVQLSPDTYTDGWDWCSGYHDTDASIMGFSHTHLSGTGAGDLLDFLVMAGTGPAKLVPGPRSNPESGYRSRFSHAEEQTEPGYYSVLFEGLQDSRGAYRDRSRRPASVHLSSKRSGLPDPRPAAWLRL